jgi:Bacterial SH3 domain
MNSRKSIAIRLLTLLFAVLAGIPASLLVADHARADNAPSLTTIGKTRLRKAPRADGEVLGVLPMGTTVKVLDCRDGWCRVFWNGQDGYAIARQLSMAAPLRWLNLPITALPDYYSSSQGAAKTAHERREDARRERDESGAEHSFILEIGSAGEWPLDGERPNFGGTIGLEVEPIENWLELEFGLSTLATAGHTDLSGDLLFKKPFRLSPSVEFMVGAGPSFSRTLNGPDRGNSWSAEFALDWMFWPTKNIGWFIEPTWSVNPRNGQQSAAVAVGVLIGFPK